MIELASRQSKSAVLNSRPLQVPSEANGHAMTGHSVWSFASGSSANRNFSIWPYSRLVGNLPRLATRNMLSSLQPRRRISCSTWCSDSTTHVHARTGGVVVDRILRIGAVQVRRLGGCGEVKNGKHVAKTSALTSWVRPQVNMVTVYLSSRYREYLQVRRRYGWCNSPSHRARSSN
jgi:hypothetical protein